jgi:signal peptidase
VKLAVKILLNLLVLLSIPMMLVAGLAAAKVVSPLIVISGSMEPEIGVGSLIVATSVKAKDLHVGDVASFKREDGVLVTHRITSNEKFEGSDELRTVRMKGDANNDADQDPYIQSDALKPLFVVPAVGSALAAVGNHKYELIALLSFGTGIFLVIKMIRSVRPNQPLRGRRRAEPVKKKEGVLSNQE